MEGRKKYRIALLLWGLLMSVAACHQEKPAGEGAGSSAPPASGSAQHITKIRVLLDSRHEPFRNVQAKMFSQLALAHAAVQVETVDCLDNAHAQQQQVEQTRDADFLLVFPIDLSSLFEPLKRAKGAGCKVMVFDGAVPAEACTTAIFCSEEKVGALAGNFLVRSLRQRALDDGYDSVIGRVVYLYDANQTTALRHRQDAFLKTLQAEPGIALVHIAPVDASGNDAAPRMAEAFRLQKNFDVIFGDTDLIAAGASAAITATQPNARDTTLIMGADGSIGKGGGIDLIVRGQIDATLWRPPLVDAAWILIERCLDDASFTPKPRYEQDPQAVSLDNALHFYHQGPPAPNVE